MENTLNAKIHSKINDWLSRLDHYHLQVSLGKMEAKDEYEKQKKEFHDYFQQYIQSAESFKNVASEKVESVKKSLNELANEFTKEEEATEQTIKKHKESLGKLINKATSL
jgi:hypothetical protein